MAKRRLPTDGAKTDLATPYERSDASARFRLVVIEGKDEGRVFEIDAQQPGPALLGQSASCHHRLDDRKVSRRHVALEVQGRSLRITDLGSTNGTFVDGVS